MDWTVALTEAHLWTRVVSRHVSRVTNNVTNYFSDDYSNPASEPGSAAKKARVTITEEQREALNIAFFLDPYPGTQAVEYLAQELGIETRSINNWFHNHRYERKECHII